MPHRAFPLHPRSQAQQRPAATAEPAHPKSTVVVVGILMGESGVATADDLTRTVLMKKDLEGAPGKEVTVFLAEYKPGGKSGKHYHPGQEFIYVVSGQGSYAGGG